jgi:hypothetical protein
MGMSMGANGLMIGGATIAAQGSAFGQGFMSSVSGMFSGGAPVTSMGSATSAAFNMGGSAANTAAMAMPYVAAALVALNALGVFRSNRTVGGGVIGTLGGDLQEYDLNRRGGTLFSGPDYSIANMRVTETTEGMNTAFTAIRNKSLEAARALGATNTGLEKFTYTLSDQLHPDLAEIGLMLDGLTAEQKQEKILGVLKAAEEAMAAIIIGSSGLQLAGETAVQAIDRLMTIQAASESLNEFGGAFSTFATASVTARQSIIELAGGLDALIQKTQGFVANFYSKEEQAGITARGIVVALETAGFTASQIAALETRGDFRTLLESLDVSSETGQKQFVALLDLQAAYSATVPIMEEQTLTLLKIAEAAPQIEILQKMFETDAQYQDRLQSAEMEAQKVFNEMLVTMKSVTEAINNLSGTMASGLSAIASASAQSTVIVQQIAAGSSGTAAKVEEVRDALGELKDQLGDVQNPTALQIGQAAIAAGVSSSELGSILGITQEQVLAHASELGLPKFSRGGYMDGLGLVGEHGPELFDPRTSQIYTAPATANMLGGSELAGEMRALRDEVSMMRHETRSTAVNTAKIFRLQDNWDVRGLTVRTDVDQPLDTVTV